jgi:hypothetical protein
MDSRRQQTRPDVNRWKELPSVHHRVAIGQDGCNRCDGNFRRDAFALVAPSQQAGGESFADLLIEKDGDTYQKESHGSPILLILRVADGKMPALRSSEKLPPFSPDGPVWRAESVKLVKP